MTVSRMPGEAERGDASEALRSAPARDFADSYRVVLPAKVRVGFEKTSEDAGQLPVGDVVEALEGRPNAGGGHTNVSRLGEHESSGRHGLAAGAGLAGPPRGPDRARCASEHGGVSTSS
jgi:hypothetical protein